MIDIEKMKALVIGLHSTGQDGTATAIESLLSELEVRVSTIYHLEQAVIEWRATAEAREADRRDAERYRWLRDHARLTDYDGGNTGVWDIRGIEGYSTWVGNRYDYRTFEGAIDAALAQRQEGE